MARLEVLPQLLVLEALAGDPERCEANIPPLEVDVVNKVLDHRGGDDVPASGPSSHIAPMPMSQASGLL